MFPGFCCCFGIWHRTLLGCLKRWKPFRLMLQLIACASSLRHLDLCTRILVVQDALNHEEDWLCGRCDHTSFGSIGNRCYVS